MDWCRTVRGCSRVCRRRLAALMCLAFSLVTPSVGLAVPGLPPPPGRASGENVARFITPGGHVDLTAIRASGYEGALDLGGRGVAIDPATHAPCAVVPGAQGTRAAGDENWSDGFGAPGVNGEVRAMAVHNGDLYVGGNFDHAGDVAARHIAMWDGISWTPLGEGIDGDIWALQSWNGSLFAAGEFGHAGSVEALRIARWDGSSWSAVSSGTDGRIFALELYQGSLIAAGEFTHAGGIACRHLARWDALSWSSVGTGTDGLVTSLAVHGSDLIVGGGFQEAGGVPCYCVARWNGASFSAIGVLPSWYVESLASHGGEIFAGVWGTVWRWDGSSWIDTLYGGGVHRFSHLGTTLVGVGWGGSTGDRAYAWTGTGWAPLGAGLGTYEAWAACEWEGRLYVGGYFFAAGEQCVSSIAQWDGANWSPVGAQPEGEGIGGEVNALTVYQGDLIAAGHFEFAGNVPASSIARWDGAAWHPLGSGVRGFENTVFDLKVWNGQLVVGGSFDYAGDLWSPCLARWNGTEWSSLAGGLTSGGSVTAVTEYDGDLVVAGCFPGVGGVSANSIARWDGGQWHALGGGLDCWVDALTVHGTDLIAGGTFTTAGGQAANRVARWDGVNWSPLGNGIPGGEVWALASFRGDLIAGGTLHDEGQGFWDLARFDGTSWGPFAGDHSGWFRGLQVIDGDLYAAGPFGWWAGSQLLRGVARYDGSAWYPLGSGVTPDARAIAQAEDVSGNYVFVGGNVISLGDGRSSVGIARWRLGSSSRPGITAITDVGNDQGRQVRVRWRRSKFDAPGQPVTITGYALFRQQGPYRPVPESLESRRNREQGDPLDLHLDGWDWVTSVPAFGDSAYQCLAPTLCDSTEADGICWSTFLIRATTDDPFTYYDSAPAQGYSIDNLAPGVPQSLRYSAPTLLVWDEAAEPDFAYHTIYGSGQAVWNPQNATRIADVVTPSFDVSGQAFDYYHVTTSDLAGNEGNAATEPSNAAAVEAQQAIPLMLAIEGVQPNPALDRLVLYVALPAASTVTVELIDLSGRIAAKRDLGTMSAGRHRIEWTMLPGAGDRLPAGLYAARITADGAAVSRKILLVR